MLPALRHWFGITPEEAWVMPEAELQAHIRYIEQATSGG